MITSVRTCTTLVLLLAATCLDGSPALAQFGAPSWAGSTLRGRYHYYNGPHVSYGRGRWGGGISNNGALVLNTLTATAGAVAPQIIPMFLPTAGGAGVAQTNAGPDGTVGTSLGENAQELESLDVNREARDKKLDDLETRSLALLTRLKLTDNPPLPQADGATATPAAAGGRSPTTGPFQPGRRAN